MRQLTEHLSKQFLEFFGVPLTRGMLTHNATDCADAAEELGFPVMVKAHIPVNGRGKLGGIRRANDRREALECYDAVAAIEKDDFRPAGARVEAWQPCVSEVYLAVLMSPDRQGPALAFSPHGGVDVEEYGELVQLPLRPDHTVPALGLRRELLQTFSRAQIAAITAVADAVARAHYALDASLVELNPLGLTEHGRAVALDARLVIDDHALFRQPALAEAVSTDPSRRPEDDVKEQFGLDYVRLHGNLGLISGGAGMTMAVMDTIADYGGSAACFLDCSANPTPEGYGAALDMLNGDDSVNAILISIFGGLTQVDRVAQNIVNLLRDRGQPKPVTIRLMGTNVERADDILAEAGYTNHHALEEAVELAVKTTAAR